MGGVWPALASYGKPGCSCDRLSRWQRSAGRAGHVLGDDGDSVLGAEATGCGMASRGSCN